MAQQIGTHQIESLLATRFKGETDIGAETIAEVLQMDLALHNQNVNGMMTELVDQTTDVRRLSGSSATVRGEKVDEFGRAATQRDLPGSEVMFPIDKYQYPSGYSSQWLAMASPTDVLVRQESREKGHLLDIQKEVKIAIYTSVNRNVTDHLVNNVAIAVKAFLNADGTPIPESPQTGEGFDGATHTHYLANATLDVASAESLINTVLEHSVQGQIQVYINAADVAAWTALTGFQVLPYPYTNIFRNTTAPDVPGPDRELGAISDFQLGWFEHAAVWVKPWAIANYAFTFDLNQPLSLAQRTHVNGFQSGLVLAETLAANPLRVDYYETQFGFGVNTRTNGAVLQFNNGSYVDPTIN